MYVRGKIQFFEVGTKKFFVPGTRCDICCFLFPLSTLLARVCVFRTQATLQERKRDSIKAAGKQKVKEELEQEARTAKQKHRDAMDVDSKEEGATDGQAEAAKAKRSRYVRTDEMKYHT